MIRYTREVLPAPIHALAWRDDKGLSIIISIGLSSKQSRSAALSAVRRLPKHQQPKLLGLAVPGMAWLLAGRLTAAAIVVGSASTTATVAGVSAGVVSVTALTQLPVPVPDQLIVAIGAMAPASSVHPHPIYPAITSAAQRRAAPGLSPAQAVANGVTAPSLPLVVIPPAIGGTLAPAMPLPTEPPPAEEPPAAPALPPPVATTEAAPPETPAPTPTVEPTTEAPPAPTLEPSPELAGDGGAAPSEVPLPEPGQGSSASQAGSS